MDEHIVFLAFGSNLGEKQKNIEYAYADIEKRIGRIISKSAFHTTEPDGFSSENLFVNSVCKVKTTLSLYALLKQTQKIEQERGRTEKSKNQIYNDRVIDIDILMFDNVVVNTAELTVPHPRLHKRLFVLIPFAEIEPEAVHPVLQETIFRLKNKCVSL